MKSLVLCLVLGWCATVVLPTEVPLYEVCPETTVQPMKKLLCYYQGSTTVDKINPCLCTHLVYTSGARISDNYTLHVEEDHERSTYALRKRNPALQFVISVTGNTSQSDALVKSVDKRQEFVKSVATYVEQADIDGVEIDFDWSTHGGVQAKDGLGDMLKLLREKLESPDVKSRQKRDYKVNEEQDDVETTTWSTKKKTKTDDPKTKTTINRRRKAKVIERSSASKSRVVFLRVPIQPEVIAKRFDLKVISKYIDNFIVATNNMTDSSESGLTYHPSRLMGLADILNTDSMMDLLTGLGAPHSMLVISVPAVATLFTLSDSEKTTPRSPAIGTPVTVNQGEMCTLLSEGGWTMERDEDLTAPYAFRNNTWIAFEDKISAGIKGKYVILRDLGGAAIFNIDDEDWTGSCKNVSKNHTDSSLLTSLHFTFTSLARKSRQALLQTLQEEIKESTLISYSGDVHLSPYRIVRVVDIGGAVHVVRKDAKTEFECSRQGYFSHPLGCNRFYRCVKFNQYTPDYTVFEYDCPAGLAFDERWEVCVWPGSLPQGSPCTGSSEIAPVPRARYSCPSVEGYFADPENCRWFFACLDHARDGSPLTAYEFRCPFGLVFDEQKLLCDWPWNVASCGNSGKNIYIGQAGFGYAAQSSLASGIGLSSVSGASNYESGYAANAGGSFGEASILTGNSGYVAGAQDHGNAAYSSSSHSSGASGYAAGSSGYAAGSSGYAAGSSGYAAGSSNYASGASGYASGASGYASGSSGYASGASDYVSGARSGYASGYANGASSGYVSGGSRYAAAAQASDASGYASGASGYASRASGYASGASSDASGASGYVSGAQSYGNNGFASGEQINENRAYSSSSQTHGNSGYAAANGHSESSSFGNANQNANGYISSNSESSSYYEGRNTASYATIPDTLVSGGRIENTGGVILGDYVASAGIVGIQQGSAGHGANSYSYSSSGHSQGLYEDARNSGHAASFESSKLNIPVVPVVPAVQTATVSSFQQSNVHVGSQNIQGVSIHTPSVSNIQPIVEQQPIVTYQSTPKAIVHEPTIFYQSTPTPIVKQEFVSYSPPVQQVVVKQPTTYFTQTSAPAVSKQEFVSYNQKVVQPIVQKPVVTYSQPIAPLQQQNVYFTQSTPQPILQVQQPVVVQKPAVSYSQTVVAPQEQSVYYTQSSPRPIIQQEVNSVQKPVVSFSQNIFPVIKEQPTVYVSQSTPRPIQQEYVAVQQPAVVVKQPTVFYQSTPRPIVKQEFVSYRQPFQQVIQPVAPQVYYQSSPRPIVKQQVVQYQQEIVQPVVPVIKQQPTVFFQSTPRPVVKQEYVQYQQQEVVQPIVPIVKQQPTVFFQSTPRPVVKQEYVQYQQQEVVQPIVPIVKQQPTVFFQSTPRPVVKQEYVQYQQQEVVQPIVPIVKQQPTVFYQSTPRPVVKQEYVQYQQQEIIQPVVPIVKQQPTVFYQSTPRPIVKQQLVSYKQPYQQVIQEVAQVVKQPTIYYQSTPRPIVKQQVVQYQQEIVQPIVPIVKQQPTVFYQSTPRPVVKQEYIQYQQQEVVQPIVPIVKQQPTVFYQSTPRPVVKQEYVQYQQQEVVQPIVPIVKQQPTVFYQSTPRPVVKQEYVQYQQQEVVQPIVPIVKQQPTVFYQSTPRPVVKQEYVQYQQQEVVQPIVPIVKQQPTVFYQSTPRPVVKQEYVQYQQQEVVQPIVPIVKQQPTVFYQSTPRPVVKQEYVQYQQQEVVQPIVPIVKQQPTVFYQSTPRPVVKQEYVQYQQQQVVQPIVPIVKQQPTVFYQSTPRPVVKQEYVQYQQQQVVQPIVPIVKQQPTVFYQSTPRPVVKQEHVQYHQEVIQPVAQVVKQPTVFYQSTPRPIVKQQAVSYRPQLQQVVVKQPTTYFTQSTIAPAQQSYDISYNQQQTNYESSNGGFAGYSYEKANAGAVIQQLPQVSSTVSSINYQSQNFEAREKEVIVNDNGEYGNVQQYHVEVTQPKTVTEQVYVSKPRSKVVVSTPAPTVLVSQEPQYVQVSTSQPDIAIGQTYQRFESSGGTYERRPIKTKTRVINKAQVVEEYRPIEAQVPVSHSVFESYDSRYDSKRIAGYVNEGLSEFKAQSNEEEYQSVQGYNEQNVDVVETVTAKPVLKYKVPVVEQYFRETSPPRQFTSTQRPVTYAAPEYLPPLQSTVVEATTFRYEERPRVKAVRKQRPRVQVNNEADSDVDSLLDQYSGQFGGIVNSNEGFINEVISADIVGKKTNVASTQGYVEITTFRPRTKTSRRKKPTTTTAKYDDDDDDSSEEEDTKLKQPIVVVTQLSDANPILIAKLGAKCTCQSNRVSLRKKLRNRNRGGDDDSAVLSGTYATDILEDSVTGDYGSRSAGQIRTSTLVPVGGRDIPVVTIRPKKRPTVTRISTDATIGSLVSTTHRPKININVESGPNVPDLELRYVKSGLRNPGYQYRRPKIPVVYPTEDSNSNDNDSGSDDVYVIPSSTVQPIIVKEYNSIPITRVATPIVVSDVGSSSGYPDNESQSRLKASRRRPDNSRRNQYDTGSDSGSYANEEHPEDARIRLENSGRGRNNKLSDGSSGSYVSQDESRPENARRRPEQSRRGPAYSGGGDIEISGDIVASSGNVKHAGKSFDRYGPGGWRGIDETLQGSVDCQRPGLFRHPKYCNKFYACHWDEWKSRYTLHVFNCPVHLSYDTSLGACNWPSKGPACVDDNLLV